MKQIAILGATGSIGTSALDVIARHPDDFRVSVLAAHSNVEALIKLCQQFQPKLAIIADSRHETTLRNALASSPTKVFSGAEALSEAASSHLCDTVIAAIVGSAGLPSTFAAAKAGKRLLLANKEAIVMAGPLLLKAVEESGGTLIPVDSEHNAIFQCLPAGQSLVRATLQKLILTASGGPFRGKKREDLQHVTPDQACAHPNWQMGRKISVDSATMMNKGLEVIEAHWLFSAQPEQIEVVIHPQSIVHSLVQYADGSTLAQLGNPDMRTALAHALAWPERIDSGVPALDLTRMPPMEFSTPDETLFRCLPLAYQALKAGGTAPILLNAANESAVAAFLQGTLPFLEIPTIIEATLQAVPMTEIDELNSVFYADLTAREQARRIIDTLAK